MLAGKKDHDPNLLEDPFCNWIPGMITEWARERKQETEQEPRKHLESDSSFQHKGRCMTLKQIQP